MFAKLDQRFTCIFALLYWMFRVGGIRPGVMRRINSKGLRNGALENMDTGKVCRTHFSPNSNANNFVVGAINLNWVSYSAFVSTQCAWWRHKIKIFSALLAFWARNSAVPGEFPAQRPVSRIFDVFFDLRLNKRLRKQSWGWWFATLSRPLWRHNNGNVLCGCFWLHLSHWRGLCITVLDIALL